MTLFSLAVVVAPRNFANYFLKEMEIGGTLCFGLSRSLEIYAHENPNCKGLGLAQNAKTNCLLRKCFFLFEFLAMGNSYWDCLNLSNLLNNTLLPINFNYHEVFYFPLSAKFSGIF